MESGIVWDEWNDADGYQVRIGFWGNGTVSGPAMATRPMGDLGDGQVSMFTRAQLDELNRKSAKLGGTAWNVTLDHAASEDDGGAGIGVSRR